MDPKEKLELQTVIADFIEMGHVENIVSMFKHDPDLYELTGDLLGDERYMVRMGMVLLFEELAVARPEEIIRAIPVLKNLLETAPAYVRGEAVTLLGIIGTPEAIDPLRPLVDDPDPQIAEIAADIIADAAD